MKAIDEEVGRFADFIGLSCEASTTELKVNEFKLHGVRHPANDVFNGTSN